MLLKIKGSAANAGFTDKPKADRRKITSGLIKLIEVNNDRFEQYRKAMEESQDKALKPVFRRYCLQSQSFKYSLTHRISSGGTFTAINYTKVLTRMWFDMNSVFRVLDREDILNSCESAEAIAIDKYKEVLSLHTLPDEAAEEVRNQKEKIICAHREIISLSSIDALFI